LADRLRSRLEKLGRWPWAEEEFRRQEGVRHEPQEPDPFSFERVKRAKALKGIDRDRLYSLFEWRDRVARRLDLPPFKVLGNRPMLELATAPVEDGSAMAKLPGLGPRFARRWGREVARVLAKPRRAPRRRPSERDPGLSAAVLRRAKRLAELRDEAAAELAIQPGLLCPRALILELAANRPGVGELGRCGLVGWRRKVLGEAFVEALGED
jgi:ribonuclease D